ncbi:MAG: hypothetical protein IJ215_01460 [Clostridia bacterium]|nr:hypothetical protein [Clostridia bacterium]
MSGEASLARGRRNLEGMHQLVEEGKFQFIAGKPYEKEYGQAENVKEEHERNGDRWYAKWR